MFFYFAFVCSSVFLLLVRVVLLVYLCLNFDECLFVYWYVCVIACIGFYLYMHVSDIIFVCIFKKKIKTYKHIKICFYVFIFFLFILIFSLFYFPFFFYFAIVVIVFACLYIWLYIRVCVLGCECVCFVFRKIPFSVYHLISIQTFMYQVYVTIVDKSYFSVEFNW